MRANQTRPTLPASPSTASRRTRRRLSPTTSAGTCWPPCQAESLPCIRKSPEPAAQDGCCCSDVGLRAVFALQVAGRHPAVYQKRRPRDELGLVAGIKHRGGSNVTGLADPADRRQRPASVVLAAAFLAG